MVKFLHADHNIKYVQWNVNNMLSEVYLPSVDNNV